MYAKTSGESQVCQNQHPIPCYFEQISRLGLHDPFTTPNDIIPRSVVKG